MQGLFEQPLFQDWGTSQLAPELVRSIRVVRGTKGNSLKAQVRDLAPNRPGVYGMLDRNDELIYVGKAKNLRTRLLGYFRTKSRGSKATRIIRQSAAVVWEDWPSEFASLLRELELIRRWRPRCNVVGQPLRRKQTFLCLGRSPAPYAFLSRKIPAKKNWAIFGPLPASEKSREAVRRLNDLFRLRDCPQPQEMIFPEQRELFDIPKSAGCLRLEIGTCLGPCTGCCPRNEYNLSVRQAREFLNGTDLSALEILEREMTEAAAAQLFEKAASIRDRWASLAWLAERLRKVRESQNELSFVYVLPDREGRRYWHLIHGARVLAVLPEPTAKPQRSAVRELLHGVYFKKSLSGMLEPYEHIDGMVVVLAWFRKYPAEMKRTMSPEAALKKCRS